MDPRDAVRDALGRVDALVLADGSPALRSAWATLVAAIDLGPEPGTRECPNCGSDCMREATTCGFCWVTLTPMAAAVH